MAPGECRRTQNLIGLPGCTEKTARFIPIGAGDLLDGMSAWEKYLNANERDALVQLAIVHAEFEALHPFLDGNGRLGRMLIPLFLFECNLLAAPTFYLSAYLEARREDYYDRLLAVSRDGDPQRGFVAGCPRGWGRRTAILVFPELLNIAEGHEVFGGASLGHKTLCGAWIAKYAPQSSLSRTCTPQIGLTRSHEPPMGVLGSVR